MAGPRACAGSGGNAPLRVLVDVFLLRIVNAHEGLDRFDDALRVADEVAVRIARREPFGEAAEQTAEMHDLAMGPAHGAKAMAVRKVFGKIGIDLRLVVFLVLAAGSFNSGMKRILTATGSPRRIDDETAGIRLVSSTRGATAGVLQVARGCYICKRKYTVVDAFYHQLCPDCAALTVTRKVQRPPAGMTPPLNPRVL